MYTNKQVATVAQRLREAMELRQKKQSDIIRATGINSGALSSYLSGRYEPKQNTIYKLANYLNIAEAWLMGYDVAMERRTIPQPMSVFRSGSKVLTLADDGNYDPRLVEEIRRKWQPPVANRQQVPILGTVPYTVSADGSKPVLGEVELNAEMSADGQFYFALIVSGDSMYPEYMDGDTILIRKQNAAETGHDVVVHVQGQAMLRRLVKSENSLTFRPLNPAYETATYTEAEMEALPVKLSGIVVEQRRRRG